MSSQVDSLAGCLFRVALAVTGTASSVMAGTCSTLTIGGDLTSGMDAGDLTPGFRSVSIEAAMEIGSLGVWIREFDAGSVLLNPVLGIGPAFDNADVLDGSREASNELIRGWVDHDFGTTDLDDQRVGIFLGTSLGGSLWVVDAHGTFGSDGIEISGLNEPFLPWFGGVSKVPGVGGLAALGGLGLVGRRRRR